MSRPLLLLTRPTDESARTLAAVEAAGFAALESPLLRIETLAFAAPEALPDAILFTSPRTPRRLAEAAPHLRACPCVCVGARTRQAAVRAGFSVVGSGDSDGDAALRLAAGLGYRRILHPRGENHMRLAVPPGAIVTPLPVYRAVAASALADDILQALQRQMILATLLFSPRTAQIFAGLVQAAGLSRASLNLVALSANVADAAGPGWRSVEVATAPRLEEALAAARRLWQGLGHA